VERGCLRNARLGSQNGNLIPKLSTIQMTLCSVSAVNKNGAENEVSIPPKTKTKTDSSSFEHSMHFALHFSLFVIFLPKNYQN